MAYRRKSVALAVAILFALSSLNSASSLAIIALPRIKGMKRILNAFSRPNRLQSEHEVEVLVMSATQIDLDSGSEKSDRLKVPPVTSVVYSLYTLLLDIIERRPFLFNSITTGILAGMGDVLAQSLQGTNGVASVSAFNWFRWRTFLLTGLLFEGPYLCVWYGGLSKLAHWLEEKYNWGPRRQVLAKVAVDQSIGVAIFYPAFFASYEIFGALLAGRGMCHIYELSSLVYFVCLFHSCL
jgi:hypothetical protein